MSISSLTAVAAQRDAGAPRRLKREPPTTEEVKAAKVGAAKVRETEKQGYFDLLVAAIPTEPLALYTFLVGGIVATIDGDDDLRLTMRWVIYAVMIVFIVLWLVGSYLRRPKEDRKRKLPVVETFSAVVAFAAWGLVMPESPLNAELSGDDQVVWILVITAAGAAILSLLTGSMKKPVKS